MTNRICSIDGCERPHKAHGWCGTHYMRVRVHGDPELPTKTVRACSVDGCEREARKRGWCTRHYKRWERHGEPTAGRTDAHAAYAGRRCNVEACADLAVRRGWCALHYARWRIHGDAEWTPSLREVLAEAVIDGLPYRLVSVPTRGSTLAVLTDEADWQRLGGYRWYITHAGYVTAFIPGAGRRGAGVKGAGHHVLLHRAIMGCAFGDGLVVDHINGVRNDNRRANLRVVTVAENAQNKRGYGKHSNHRGVSYDAARGRWVAYLKIPGQRLVMLGRFQSEEAAATVAAAARAQHMPYAVAR